MATALDGPSRSQSSVTHLDLWYMEPIFNSRDAFECFSSSIRRSAGQVSRRVYWKEDESIPSNIFVSPQHSSDLPPDEVMMDIMRVLDSLDECRESSLNHSQKASVSLSTSTRVRPLLSFFLFARSVHVQAITRALHGTLISALLDTLPAMNQTPSETEIKTLLAVTRIHATLYSALFRFDALVSFACISISRPC